MNLIDVMKETEHDFDRLTLRSYSGRGMNGRNCMGVVGEPVTVRQFIGEVIKRLAEDVVGEALDGSEEETDNKGCYFAQCVDTLMSYKEDTMGYRSVYYWPDVGVE